MECVREKFWWFDMAVSCPNGSELAPRSRLLQWLQILGFGKILHAFGADSDRESIPAPYSRFTNLKSFGRLRGHSIRPFRSAAQAELWQRGWISHGRAPAQWCKWRSKLAKTSISNTDQDRNQIFGSNERWRLENAYLSPESRIDWSLPSATDWEGEGTENVPPPHNLGN